MNEEKTQLSEEKILKGFSVGLKLFWTVLIAITILGMAGGGNNPLKISDSVRQTQLAVFPQGWSFFTRDPKEPIITVYKIHHDKAEKITFANSSRNGHLGLSRAGRAMDVEAGRLLTPIIDKSWKPCINGLSECFPEPDTRPVNLKNWSRTRYVCGEVVFLKRPPVPWAWSSARQRIEMDGEILHAIIDCSAEIPLVYR